MNDDEIRMTEDGGFLLSSPRFLNTAFAHRQMRCELARSVEATTGSISRPYGRYSVVGTTPSLMHQTNDNCHVANLKRPFENVSQSVEGSAFNRAFYPNGHPKHHSVEMCVIRDDSPKLPAKKRKNEWTRDFENFSATAPQACSSSISQTAAVAAAAAAGLTRSLQQIPPLSASRKVSFATRMNTIHEVASTCLTVDDDQYIPNHHVENTPFNQPVPPLPPHKNTASNGHGDGYLFNDSIYHHHQHHHHHHLRSQQHQHQQQHQQQQQQQQQQEQLFTSLVPLRPSFSTVTSPPDRVCKSRPTCLDSVISGETTSNVPVELCQAAMQAGAHQVPLMIKDVKWTFPILVISAPDLNTARLIGKATARVLGNPPLELIPIPLNFASSHQPTAISFHNPRSNIASSTVVSTARFGLTAATVNSM